MSALRLVTVLAVAGGLGLSGCSKPSKESKAASQQATEEKLFDAEAPGERAKDAAPVFTHLTVWPHGSCGTSRCSRSSARPCSASCSTRARARSPSPCRA